MKPEIDLRAISSFVSGKNKFQIQRIRDGIVKEIAALSKSIDERMGDDARLDDPARFAIQRDRFTVMRRRHEVDYLDSLLVSPHVKYGVSNDQ